MKNHNKADAEKKKECRSGVDRRRFLQESAATGLVALAAPHLLLDKPSRAAGRAVKIGFVAPRSGALERFGEANDFILAQIRKLVAEGLVINGVSHLVEIIERDSLSNRSHGAEVALDLIKTEHVDLMLSSSTGETVIPVSDVCEAHSVPCITTDCPWQSYFFGRGGKVEKGFQWTYHFFWGLEDLISVFANMWTDVSTNQVVGALWPNDAEGVAYSDMKFGFPSKLQARGFKLVDPGRYELSTRDFSEQIKQFKEAKVEILTGVMPPPAFAAFWKQAGEANFVPKVATVAKALLFPTAVEALGDRGADLTTEIWWSPSFPFKSGLTGQNAAELCAAYEDETKKQWTQPIGFHHALFEIALDVLKRSKDIDSPASIRDAIRATNYESMVGHISWHGKPVPNVTKTTLVGGQWVPGYKFDKWLAGQKFKYDLVIVNNADDDMIGVQRKMEALGSA
jgi:branched-chain amino acid transport system substrate-binding protein